MLRRNHILAVASLLTLLSTASGCVSHRILAFEDHPKHPVTAMQVYQGKNYFVYKTLEHRFYTCNDTGDQLVCKRVCGGNTDVRCPAAFAGGYVSSTNVR